MSIFRFRRVLGCALCFTGLQFSPLLFAGSADGTTAAASPQPAAAPADDDNTAAAAPEGRLSRWLDIDTMSFSARWRNMADSNGFHLFNVGQERSLLDGKVKLDSAGKYSIHFHASSGEYFNWAYSDFMGGGFDETAGPSLTRMSPALVGRLYAAIPYSPPVQLQSGGWGFRVRQLYMSAAPIKQIEFQYGSLAIAHGLNSEITSYDDDGYMSGGRLIYRDPQHVYFDELSATFGYLGDYFIPNFFERGDSLTRSNYHQFQGVKKFGTRLQASADFTEHFGTHTLREALMVRLAESHIADGARLELYQRTNTVVLPGNFAFSPGHGFAVSGNKTLLKHVKVEGGYADIDSGYGVYTGNPLYAVVGFAMNGDSYGQGNRVFAKSEIKLNSYLGVFGFYTHIVGTNNFYVYGQQNLNTGLSIDFKELLSNKAHLF